MKSQVYSILSGEQIEVTFPSTLAPPSKHPLRRHSGVIVKNSLTNKIETGTIVSHLTLSEWSVVNGYQVIDYGRTYKARPSEITRLF